MTFFVCQLVKLNKTIFFQKFPDLRMACKKQLLSAQKSILYKKQLLHKFTISFCSIISVA